MARISRLNWTYTESGQIYHYDTFCPGSNTLPSALVITMVPTFRSHPVLREYVPVSMDRTKYFYFTSLRTTRFFPLLVCQFCEMALKSSFRIGLWSQRNTKW